MKKKRVAILLHGLLRSWKECSTVYSYWPELYPDLEFDFYLCSWEKHNQLPIEKGQQEEFIDNKFLKFKNYKLYKQEESIKLPGQPGHMVHYYQGILSQRIDGFKGLFIYPFLFLKQQVCRLMMDEGIEYDGVLITRPDMFVHKEFLDHFYRSVMNEKNTGYKNLELGDNILYNPSGSNFKLGSLFCDSDTIWYGNQKAIEKAWKDCFHDPFVYCKVKPQGLHRFQATYLNWKRIYNFPIREIGVNIVRSTFFNNKNGNPVKEDIALLIQEYGIDLYDININTLRSKHFNIQGSEVKNLNII